MAMRKLKKYKPTKFMAKDSHYDKAAADYAVMFIEALCHTKGTWAGKPFELIDWQEQIIRDLFGILKPNGYRQFNTAYIEIPKKQGIRQSLPIVLEETIELSTTVPSPISEQSILVFSPMMQSSPILVLPISVVPGRITVSCPISTA